MSHLPLSVLIVEDEVLIEMLLSDMLCALGHTVAGSASRVADAIRFIDGPAQIDVAILDLNLGGESSLPVADMLDRKGVPLVFATGYGVSNLPDRLQARPILQKPYTIEAVASALKQAV